MFPEKPDEKIKLIISANGNPEYFDQVITLADMLESVSGNGLCANEEG
jgi:hypothetical protein